MDRSFVQDNFLELLADALTDGMHVSGSHPGKRALTDTCSVCGCPSSRSKCDVCFRAYHTERDRIRRARQKGRAA